MLGVGSTREERVFSLFSVVPFELAPQSLSMTDKIGLTRLFLSLVLILVAAWSLDKLGLQASYSRPRLVHLGTPAFSVCGLHCRSINRISPWYMDLSCALANEIFGGGRVFLSVLTFTFFLVNMFSTPFSSCLYKSLLRF